MFFDWMNEWLLSTTSGRVKLHQIESAPLELVVGTNHDFFPKNLFFSSINRWIVSLDYIYIKINLMFQFVIGSLSFVHWCSIEWFKSWSSPPPPPPRTPPLNWHHDSNLLFIYVHHDFLSLIFLSLLELYLSSSHFFV